MQFWDTGRHVPMRYTVIIRSQENANKPNTVARFDNFATLGHEDTLHCSSRAKSAKFSSQVGSWKGSPNQGLVSWLIACGAKPFGDPARNDSKRITDDRQVRRCASSARCDAAQSHFLKSLSEAWGPLWQKRRCASWRGTFRTSWRVRHAAGSRRGRGGRGPRWGSNGVD